MNTLTNKTLYTSITYYYLTAQKEKKIRYRKGCFFGHQENVLKI